MDHAHARVSRLGERHRVASTIRSCHLTRSIAIRWGCQSTKCAPIGLLHTRWMEGRIGLHAAAPLKWLKFSPPYYLGLAILVVLMVVALVKAYQMWEEIHDVPEPDSPTDLLASFEEAHAAGELDDLELERVKQRLVGPIAGQDEPSVPADEEAKNPDNL
jgi:hypothetical protein